MAITLCKCRRNSKAPPQVAPTRCHPRVAERCWTPRRPQRRREMFGSVLDSSCGKTYSSKLVWVHVWNHVVDSCVIIPLVDLFLQDFGKPLFSMNFPSIYNHIMTVYAHVHQFSMAHHTEDCLVKGPLRPFSKQQIYHGHPWPKFGIKILGNEESARNHHWIIK